MKKSIIAAAAALTLLLGMSTGAYAHGGHGYHRGAANYGSSATVTVCPCGVADCLGGQSCLNGGVCPSHGVAHNGLCGGTGTGYGHGGCHRA